MGLRHGPLNAHYTCGQFLMSAHESVVAPHMHVQVWARVRVDAEMLAGRDTHARTRGDADVLSDPHLSSHVHPVPDTAAT